MKSILISKKTLVVAGVFIVAGIFYSSFSAFSAGQSGSGSGVGSGSTGHGQQGSGPYLAYTSAPLPADNSVQINVNGALSSVVTACGPDTGPDTVYTNVPTGGAYLVIGGAV